MKILHVITTLSLGGAEKMLYNLIEETARSGLESAVISLTSIGPVGERIQALDVPVHALGMRPGKADVHKVIELAMLIRRIQPDVLQTWMYHADLIVGLTACFSGNRPVIWGIHHSNLDSVYNKRTTLWTARVSAKLSRWLPSNIVCCSFSSMREHLSIGYAANKMVVIPNGINTFDYRPFLNEEKQLVREELGIPRDAKVIGLIARFNPLKGHRNFFQAARIIFRRFPNIRFVLCGEGITTENKELSNLLSNGVERQHLHLLGPRSDIPRLFAALDIGCSASYGEGLPVAIGEMMSCGIPCAVTDVGDSAILVGETGIVVPPGKPHALADACSSLLSKEKNDLDDLGKKARKRIKRDFSVSEMARKYEELYRRFSKENTV